MIQFLIDEDVTPKLQGVANDRGYTAYAVQYLDQKGAPDFVLRRLMLDQNLTLVTGNWKDFRPMLAREGIHPGAISLPDVPRADQIRLFHAAIDHIEGSDPPLDMINTVLVLNEQGRSHNSTSRSNKATQRYRDEVISVPLCLCVSPIRSFRYPPR